MEILGIDPGARGGLALINHEEVLTHAPLTRLRIGNLTLSRISESTLYEMFTDRCVRCVAVERQQSQGPRTPGPAAVSMGANFGAVLAQLLQYRIMLYLPYPATWQAGLGLRKLPGKSKDKSRECAWGFGLPKNVKHDGICDAVCIAMWAAQQAGNKGKGGAESWTI